MPCSIKVDAFSNVFSRSLGGKARKSLLNNQIVVSDVQEITQNNLNIRIVFEFFF
jgi:hypothetical protein